MTNPSPTPPKRGEAVTFKVLGSVLAAAAILATFLLSQHASAGHDRHDRAVETAKAATAAQLRVFENRLVEHANFEDRRLQALEQGILRIESKQDQVIRRGGYGFPRGAPPLADIPATARPGGWRGVYSDPLLERTRDAGTGANDAEGEGQ